MGRDARTTHDYNDAADVMVESSATTILRALCKQAKQRDQVLAYFVEMALHHSRALDMKESYFRDDSILECSTSGATL